MVLSIPDGFPCIIFSPSYAHMLINFRESVLAEDSLPHKLCVVISKMDLGQTAPTVTRRLVATTTEYDADEPNPAPTGTSELTKNFPPIKLKKNKKVDIYMY